MSSPDEDRIRKYEEAHVELRRELAQMGFLWIGTVIHQTAICGKASCACRTVKARRHGPYYVWTRKVRGKTVTRMLTEAEGKLYTEWIQNRRRLDRTIKKMMSISKHLAPLLLRRSQSP